MFRLRNKRAKVTQNQKKKFDIFRKALKQTSWEKIQTLLKFLYICLIIYNFLLKMCFELRRQGPIILTESLNLLI